MFFMDHWGKMSIVVATVALIIAFVVLLMRLDSYGRNTMLAYIPIIVKRIKNEEAVLEEDLKGYAEYKDKVKYRIIPFIW